ncbi:MAG TPA: PDZ domain-containing protein [Fimbriimonadaceae bacterium]|nr:PDZ domain-containing protein [Fimbriimonadaceae bacterium]
MAVRNAALVAAFLSQFAVAWADIDYRVAIPQADGQQRMQVTLRIPVESAVTQLQIPSWGPGSYDYPFTPFWKNVDDVKATVDGKDVDPIKPNDYTWTLSTPGARVVTFSYTVPVSISEETGHYRGPSSYVYVVDRKEEKCDLTIDLPSGWNIATGLDGAKGHFTAPTYDVLADNPVTFGKYRELHYVVDGRPHILAMYGPARNDVDTNKLLKACSFISAAENDFFGNHPPYTHYVWHFNVGNRPDGGGGLEHLASTEITLANGLGPGIIGVNAHEFFHLWNVKRIRARVLGPFDYTKLPETGALWWLEGITEYYAHQLMTRYGYWNDKKWYATICTNVGRVRSNPSRLEVGPYEASFRVKDANNGQGNSNGYKISYYDLGVVAGVCLDIEILSQTKGKHSLDDVEHALWDMCKNSQPGFAEDEIRKQCVHFGGPALGEMYDRIIMHGGEMPVEAQLAKVGLTMATTDKEFTDFGATFGRGQGGLSIALVTAAGRGKLERGDVVLSINGTDVSTPAAAAAAVAKIKPGDAVAFKVKRGDQTMDVSVTAASLSRPSLEIAEDPNATADQKALREIWLYRGKKGWKPPVVGG